MEYKFKLVQAAKKAGGDKYECMTNPDFTVYFPQSISRINGVVRQEIVVNID